MYHALDKNFSNQIKVSTFLLHSKSVVSFQILFLNLCHGFSSCRFAADTLTHQRAKVNI